jgi:hypothetical protein
VIPQYQSRTGADGTCFRTCLAAIFNLREVQVPDFTGDGEEFFAQVDDYLATRGLTYRRVPVGGAKPSGYSTVEGVSPRGGLHACVAKDGVLVWDPHPQDGTGRGLVEPRYYGLLEPLGGKVGDALDAVGVKVVYGPFSTKSQADSALTKLRRSKDYRLYDMTYVSERFTRPSPAQEAAGYELGDLRLSQGFFVFGAPKYRGADRADMLALRRNTERQGGPFFMQETNESGEESTVPVRSLRKY